MESFFKRIKLPSGPIKINSTGTINDIKKYIKSNLKAAEQHNGKPIYKPYFEKLLILKEYLKT